MDNGILAKYFGRQDPDLYGGRVAGRSLDGFPIVGASVPHLTQREMEELPLYNNFHAGWFRLWDDDDRARFVKIMDHVYNGEFFIKRRFDVPVPGHPADEPGGSLKVWLEWTQVEARPPARADLAPPDDGGGFSAFIPVPPGGGP